MATLANWASTKAYNDEDLAPNKAIHEIPPPTEPNRSSHPFLVATLFSIFYAIVGIILIYRYGITQSDNISRVFNAYSTFMVHKFNLANIGFIWNPLPTILEIPLVALHNLWPALLTKGIAGIFVSAVFGGVAIFNIYKMLSHFGLRSLYRTTATVLFGLNPLIVFYAANGMSDIMLLAAMLGVAYCIILYLENQRIYSLVLASLWLAIGFGARYESGIYALTIGMAIIILLSTPKLLDRKKGIGILIVLELPIIYSVGIWVAANWIIMGNPLYFMDSRYSNAAQVATGIYHIARSDRNIVNALWFVLERTIIFPPLIIALLVTSWGLIKHKVPKVIWILLALGLGEPITQVLLLTLGADPGLERYFIFYIPLGFLLTAFIIAPTCSRWRMIGITLLAIGNLFTWVGSNTTNFGKGVNTYISVVAKGGHLHPHQSSIKVASYLNAHPKMTILVDSFMGWPVIIHSSNPGQFITTDNINFHSVVNHPIGKVQAILVPQPTGNGKLDAINQKYPGLWAGKEPWSHLVFSVRGSRNWRLYKINKP